jgi:hypothetical protein
MDNAVMLASTCATVAPLAVGLWAAGGALFADALEHLVRFRRAGFRWPRDLSGYGVVAGGIIRALLGAIAAIVACKTGILGSPQAGFVVGFALQRFVELFFGSFDESGGSK